MRGRVRSREEQVSNWCFHFTGISHDTCKAGVRYDDVKGAALPRSEGGIFALPCLKDEGLHLSCSMRRWKTPEEIKAQVEESEAVFRKTLAAMSIVPEIKKLYKGRNWNGTRECPVCKGVLHLSHAAFNGHVWGKCETKDCVAWIE